MPHVLFTGAGFSRNWGGWLADEAFEYLIGCPDINSDIHTALWLSKNQKLGFEHTLESLRHTAEKYKADQRFQDNLKIFMTMLEGMFHSMNSAFKQTRFNPLSSSEPADYIRQYLSGFDAIFTLNQDCLLELQYNKDPNEIHRLSTGRWRGFYSPGVASLAIGGTEVAPPGLFQVGDSGFKLDFYKQPYFKLHGSSNWRQGDSSILIMGGNKGPDIDRNPLLSRYRDIFTRTICQSDSRVVIIGYGFKDPHINEMLVRGARAGAKFFIVDPEGVDAIKRVHSDHYRPAGIIEPLTDALYGASRRDLRTTFGGDHVERGKLLRFLTRLSPPAELYPGATYQ